MEYPDCVKAFDAYASAAKQIDELVGFMPGARIRVWPGRQSIQRCREDWGFVRDRSKGTKSPERRVEPVPPPPQEEEPQNMNEIKALPAPENYTPPPPP
ncbi:hypothetical protein GBA52_001049 [Prunus armeniaca]|nr:hypothetical protein GBA52_001049 [Prunus armeniaca]